LITLPIRPDCDFWQLTLDEDSQVEDAHSSSSSRFDGVKLTLPKFRPIVVNDNPEVTGTLIRPHREIAGASNERATTPVPTTEPTDA
jgi:hypothetical protein